MYAIEGVQGRVIIGAAAAHALSSLLINTGANFSVCAGAYELFTFYTAAAPDHPGATDAEVIRYLNTFSNDDLEYPRAKVVV